MAGKPGNATPKPPPDDPDRRIEQEALVDFEGEQSFPASDPPSWTLGPDKEPANGWR